MTKSRLFLYTCLSFALGIAVNHWIIFEFKIVLLACCLLAIVGLLSRVKTARVLAFLWIIFFVGLSYGGILGEGSLIGSGFLNPVIRLLTDFRLHIEDMVCRMISEPYAGLLNGIILGTKSGLGYELTKDFKITGLMHIVAVSGYNVTIVINAFYLAAKPLAYRWRMGLSLGLIFLFIILTGGSASVVRAGIMGGMVVIARLFGRKAMAINSLIFAAFLMIVEKPSILVGDIGFQLSVAATVGIVLINPIFIRVGDRGLVLKKIPESLKEALFSTLSASAMTLPIILYYFGNLSLVSPISNLIILPIIPVAMLVGFMVLAGGLLYYPIGYVMGFGAWFMLYIIVQLIRLLAEIPYASVVLDQKFKLLIIPYYLLVFWVIYINSRKNLVNQDEKN